LEPVVVVRIHPGQCLSARPGCARCRARCLLPAALALAASVLPFPHPLTAQLVEPGGQEAHAADLGALDAVGAARGAQARFERRRVGHLPVSIGASPGPCDERVGRFCTWYSEGEWYPKPEAPEIIGMRMQLLSSLDSLQALDPSSDWILGQRVWYRAEAGDWAGALHAAEACEAVDPWWCSALQGFVHHGRGAYPDAEASFDEMLSRMSPERAERWATPRWPVDVEARRLLEDEAHAFGKPRPLRDRLWALADPLWIVPGNDRRSAHFARWVVTELRDGARNPFMTSWGDDMSQLTVRHGWEMGWERSLARAAAGGDDVIGHKHPQGRDYLPRGAVLRAPSEATSDDFLPDRTRPRSLYAPAYAPVLLPMAGQLATFPRLAGAIVVATHPLPPDTTFHAGHDHPRPWMDPGDQAGLQDRVGLVAMSVGLEAGSGLREVTTQAPTAGALALDLDPGEYVVSSERWSPSGRVAGRLRVGMVVRPAIEDVASLSDLLLLRVEPGSEVPASLEEALDRALPGLSVMRGQSFAIGWEVAGLGFRPEVLEFQLSIEPAGRGVLRRVGAFLRVVRRPHPLGLQWEEPAAAEPGHEFHHLVLDLSELRVGRYRLVLTLRTAQRESVSSTAEIEVLDPR
jgi:hypothetical protein